MLLKIILFRWLPNCKPKLARILSAYAKRTADSGKLKKAIELYKEAIELPLTSSWPLVELARLVTDVKYQMELYQRAIQIDNNPWAHIKLAQLWLNEENYKLVEQTILQLKSCDFRSYQPNAINLITQQLKELEASINQLKTRSNLDNLINKKTTETQPFFRTLTGNLLFFAPHAPDFDQSSGGKRFLEILKILRTQLKYNVFFITSEVIHPKHLNELQAIGIRVISTRNPAQILRQLKTQFHNFDCAFFAWWTAGEHYIPLVKEIFPDIKIIVDSVDIHWVREERGKCSSKEKKEREKSVYLSSDLVFVVTEEDRKHLIDECGSRINVKILSNIHREEVSKFQDGKNLIFIGGFNHPPNIQAAINSARIFRRFVQETNLKIKLYIVGHNPPKQVQMLHDGVNIIVTGQVERPEYYLNDSRALLAPLTWGAGIKGKICQAVMNKVPVITTDIGNEGINFKNLQEAFIANSDDDFISYLKLLFSLDSKFLFELTQNAFKKVIALTSEENARIVLETTLSPKPVVISILTHNNSTLLRKCVKSIINKTLYPNYKIVITANGCSDNTDAVVSYLIERYPDIDIEYIKKAENDFFLRPTNEVFEKYRNYDVVLLNDDVEIISKCWLTQLNLAAYSAGYISCAGGKTLYPDGTLYSGGTKLLIDGDIVQMVEKDSPDKEIYNKLSYADYLSGCLLYMRRDAINKIGFFDERFYPMYFEEKDWQYRGLLKGYKNMYEPKCVSIHEGGATAGPLKEKYAKINLVKFTDKYQEVKLDVFGYLEGAASKQNNTSLSPES